MSYKVPISKSLRWDASKQISALIAGSRGMGKSWFAMYLAQSLAELKPSSQLFVIDFKQSDFSRLDKLLPDGRVAKSKEEIFSLLERYVTFMKKRADFVNKNTGFGATANSLGMPLYYLIYDEFGAFTSTLDSKEKKLHDNYLSQIALLGRQYNFGLLAIMQQASVGNSGLNSSIKEQFGLIAHMGEANKAAYRATFGESIDIPNERLNRGEGFIWLQGLTTNGSVRPFVAKELSESTLWEDFRHALVKQNDENYLYSTNNNAN